MNRDLKSELTQFLTFFVAGEEYAVPILKVREIIEYDLVTPVPKTPRSVRGVINLRGNVVPVVDIAVKFGLPETKLTKFTCIIIVEVAFEGQPITLGLVADAVSQVVDLHEGDIEPPPSFGTKVDIEYLVGMGKVDRKFVLILDIDRVISSNELAVGSDVDSGDPLSLSESPQPEVLHQ